MNAAPRQTQVEQDHISPIPWHDIHSPNEMISAFVRSLSADTEFIPR